MIIDNYIADCVLFIDVNKLVGFSCLLTALNSRVSSQKT